MGRARVITEDTGDYPHRDLTERIIGCAIEVHRELGPGLLESAYEAALSHELTIADVAFSRQLRVPVMYKGIDLNLQYRIDLLVEEMVVVELKAVEKINDVHKAQLLTYLRLLDKRIGLLINFNEVVLTRGVKRMIL